MQIPELGIGIIYFPGFEPIIESNPELVQFIEIEPQTFWAHHGNGLDSFSYSESVVRYLKSLRKQLVFHGVGFPVGNPETCHPSHIPCLKEMIEELRPQWLSEHLSFNRIYSNGEELNTNFLLPPIQTKEGVERAAGCIRNYAVHFNIPFAFETGVNYLSPKPFEMDDGHFIQAVSENADCYILLDLHNLLANQKNGRQNVKDLLKQLDPQRIIEIHLAGGFYYKGFYLDAHSDVSSTEVIDLFEDVVATLPNLKAITFEMQSENLPRVRQEQLRLQLERMNRIWDKRGKKLQNQSRRAPKNKFIPAPSAQEWENTLGFLAIGRKPPLTGELQYALEKDQGLTIIQELITEFRSSLIVSSLKLSCRWLMLQYGLNEFKRLISSFSPQYSPKLFASDSGLSFAQYLLNDCSLIENNNALKEFITYEKKSLETLLDGIVREVELSFHPVGVIKSLQIPELPTIEEGNLFRLTIEPDESFAESATTVFHS